MSSSRSSRFHSVLVKSAPSSSCWNSQTMACDAVGDEHAAQRLRVVQQALAQQRELLLEDLTASLCSSSSSSLARLERCAPVVAASSSRERSARAAHRMISASQLAATRLTLGLQFGRDLDLAERARDQMADFLGGAVDDDRGLLEQFGHVLVAGLAVGALGEVVLARCRPGAAAPSPLRPPLAPCSRRGRRRTRRRTAPAPPKPPAAALRGGRQLGHGAGDRVERGFALVTESWYWRCSASSSTRWSASSFSTCRAGEILQRAPVLAALLDQLDDACSPPPA